MRSRKNNTFSILIAISILCLSLFSYGIADLQAQEQAFVKTSRVWTIVMPGAHPTIQGSVSSGWYPNDFDIIGNTGAATPVVGNAVDLFIKDWETEGFPEASEKYGPVINNAVFGPSSEFNPDGTVVEQVSSYVRYAQPTHQVNFVDITQNQYGQVNVDELIGTSDQTVKDKFRYYNGVECERTVFAFSNQFHHDYVVTEMVFTNTSNQTLNSVMIGFDLPHYGKAWGSNPNPGVGDDGLRWYHYYGALPSDTQRVFYSYHADDPEASGDNMANPAVNQQGRLIDAGAQFLAFIHASEQPWTNPVDDADDPIQPRTTYAAKSGVIGVGTNGRQTQALSQPSLRFEAAYGQIAAENPMPGVPANTWHEHNGDNFGDPDPTAYSQYMSRNHPHGGSFGIGPYDLGPGESVRIVYAWGHAGLGLEGSIEIGRQFANNTLTDPPNIPDSEVGYFPPNFVYPSDAREIDKIKNRWYSTVIDSIHKTVYKIRHNMSTGWNVPGTPPPPQDFRVTGFPDEARIEWAASGAEDDPNFAGYRIMRKKSNLDTALFQQVGFIEPSEASTDYTFPDTDIQFGASYYYFVQSGFRIPNNAENALPENQGKIVWSGRTLIPTPEEINPPRGGSEELDDIVVAPNPYNINAPSVRAQGWTDDRGIVFFNVPDYCEIDIYTENGDLVKSILHDSPIGAGSVYWDMLTDNQMVIQSGVYIATFTNQTGGLSFRKFVVAR